MTERTIFGSDRPLLYDVAPWSHMGFAVANFGDNVGTLSKPIANLADYIGKAQLYVMTHIDAQRTQPPSRNTVERIGKLINRIRSVLAGRQRLDNEVRLEGGHASADLTIWNMHPTPYFSSAVVRNHWLVEYNQLVMVGLTNMYQHSDNNLALTVTAKFAQDVWQYFREIKLLMGSELLGIPLETLRPDEFEFTDEHFGAYNPSSVVLNMEWLDTPGPIQSRATEDDLRPLYAGIPANLILSNLRQYPVADDIGYSGSPYPQEADAPGTTDGSATASAGGTIGRPQM